MNKALEKLMLSQQDQDVSDLLGSFCLERLIKVSGWLGSMTEKDFEPEFGRVIINGESWLPEDLLDMDDLWEIAFSELISGESQYFGYIKLHVCVLMGFYEKVINDGKSINHERILPLFFESEKLFEFVHFSTSYLQYIEPGHKKAINQKIGSKGAGKARKARNDKFLSNVVKDLTLADVKEMSGEKRIRFEHITRAVVLLVVDARKKLPKSERLKIGGGADNVRSYLKKACNLKTRVVYSEDDILKLIKNSFL